MFAVLVISAVKASWPSYGGDERNTAWQVMRGAMTSPRLKWRDSFRWVEYQFGAIADVDLDGRPEVVLHNEYGLVRCYDGATGNLEWDYSNSDIEWSSTACVGDFDSDGKIEIAFGGWSGTGLICLYVDGSLVGTQWTTGSLNGSVYGSANAADVDGDGEVELVFETAQQVLYCVSGSNGQVEWSVDLGAGSDFRGAPAVGQLDADPALEVVGFARDDYEVVCVDGATGQVEWRFQASNTFNYNTSPAIGEVDGDRAMEVVFGDVGGNLYALNGEDGSLAWQVNLGGSEVSGSPAIGDIDGDGAHEVVAATPDATYGVDKGSIVWSYPTTGIMSPVSLADIDGDTRLEVLAASHDDSSVYCINAENGTLLWRGSFSGLGVDDIHSPFIGDIDGDGCSEVVVGASALDADSGGVYALDDPYGATGCGSEMGVNPRGGAFPVLRQEGRGVRLILESPTQARLALYDPAGRLIQLLWEGTLAPGSYLFLPRAKGGVYLLVLETERGSASLTVSLP